MTRLLSFVLVISMSTMALAQSGDTVEAGKRFTAGVALYNEADYRAALVEFKRAYELAPSALVLYNIGQTYFQLQDYAAAYLTLSQFLKEAPGNADHRAEVEQTVQQLQARIGKILVETNVAGAEVKIDGEVVGKTPLAAPVLVSIGRRKVEISAAGRVPWERVIDVAAGDTIRQEITLEQPKVDSGPVVVAKPKGSPVVPILWASTGVLAAGAITFGVLAWSASNTLDDLRGTYPVSPTKLDDQADKVGLYSHLADGLGIAAIAVGGTALVVTLLRKSSDDGKEHASIGIGPRGIVVGGTF